jgi:hypothetical protein
VMLRNERTEQRAAAVAYNARSGPRRPILLKSGKLVMQVEKVRHYSVAKLDRFPFSDDILLPASFRGIESFLLRLFLVREEWPLSHPPPSSMTRCI